MKALYSQEHSSKDISATAEDSSDVHEKFEIFFVIELIYLVFNFSKKENLRSVPSEKEKIDFKNQKLDKTVEENAEE